MMASTAVERLTIFKKDPTAGLRRMEETGSPLVLTVNGKARLVVLDADDYEKLAEAAERAETVDGIRRGLEDVQHGRTRPAHEVFARLRSQTARTKKS